MPQFKFSVLMMIIKMMWNDSKLENKREASYLFLGGDDREWKNNFFSIRTPTEF